MKTIVINRLKGIKQMKFTIPEEKGVYLIAGANGCGKTTLLVCLDRICNGLAFANEFSRTSSWSAVDQYDNATITYTIDNDSVEYKKKKTRWAPNPRKDSGIILDKFGFSTSIFIHADSKRIDIKREDLKAGNFATVDSNVKQALNMIFETQKYDRLQRLKNTNGRGKTSVYFYVIREGSGASTTYYSEKRFSTGELAMVRLVEQVEVADNGTMVLLDEAELALHPRVQVKLLEYLKKKVQEKNLWVFISTHSPTMLKASKKEDIMLLRKDETKTIAITPCYPAQAIGDVDFSTSNIFDYIFFVEDDVAKTVLRYMRERYVMQMPKHATALCNIIPVGGFYETARLAVTTNTRLFGDSRVYAVVDEDAVEELDSKPKFKKLYNNHRDIIKTLSFTPEVWLINKIEGANGNLKRVFLDKYNLEMSDIIKSDKYSKCKSPKKRQLAKDKFSVFVGYLCCVSGTTDENVIISEIIEMIIYDVEIGEVKRVMGPLFSA